MGLRFTNLVKDDLFMSSRLPQTSFDGAQRSLSLNSLETQREILRFAQDDRFGSLFIRSLLGTEMLKTKN